MVAHLKVHSSFSYAAVPQIDRLTPSCRLPVFFSVNPTDKVFGMNMKEWMGKWRLFSHGIQLLADLNLRKTPQLVELVDDNNDVEELMGLAPEKVLLTWMNFHLKKAGYKKLVTNFSSDLKKLMHTCLIPATLDTKDPSQRANLVLEHAEKMDCKRYLAPKDIVEGSANLNLAFVPIKTLVIDGNCRAEDRGLKTQQGLMVYVLLIYNKKDKYHRMTMAAFNIQEALIWKEKIESFIDQHQESLTARPSSNFMLSSCPARSLIPQS
ncbi:hypothetical protein LXL04_024196 [Taraxacum kok-saghyz]